MRIYLNNDWYFTKSFNLDLLESEYDTNSLEIVRLPHSFVEMPFNYFDERIYQCQSRYI